jgi:hypothetical protein
MKGVCRLCGCTDSTPCITEEGPCSWVLDDLCSACCVFLEDQNLIIPKECRHCAHVIEGEPWQGKRNFTCEEGRFDEPALSQDAHHWFAWRGISRPNKTVAKAQAKCPHFQVHGRYLEK